MTLRVEWAIACRYCEVNNNLATIVGAGIDHTYIPAVPQNVQVLVAARIVGDPHELFETPHTIRCVAMGPQVSVLARAEGQIDLQAPVMQRDWLASLHIPIAIVFLAETEGAYRLDVSIDDGDPYLLPMHISTTLPPGAIPPADPADN